MMSLPTLGERVRLVLSDCSEVVGFVELIDYDVIVTRTSPKRTRQTAIAAVIGWTVEP